MTIERTHGMYVIECDECGDIIEEPEEPWTQFWERMKDQGWIVRQPVGKGEWQHYCPVCAPDIR